MIQIPRMGQVKQLHFVGIGGVGMAGIAEVLLGEGYIITGSDTQNNGLVQRLRGMGAVITIGHQAENIAKADVVVRSSAIGADNVELMAASVARIPIVPRATMLAELMRFRYSIAIAGTHGKTTTTSLAASVFAEAGMDPTYVIGGKLNHSESNARLGQSKYLIAEADESDQSFLLLNPMIAVVTNIDADHLTNFAGKFANVKQAFLEFLHHLPFYGLAILCVDDPVVAELIPELSCPYLTYGFSASADICISNYQQAGARCQFTLNNNPIELAIPGEHNALNAAAAYALAQHEGLPLTAIQSALTQFSGVGRRFDNKGMFTLVNKSVRWIDDYAHHPKEIAVTLAAAKAAWPDKRVVCVLQPHRYSRVQELFDDFCRVLAQADLLILLNVYAAGEPLQENATSQCLAQAIRQRKTVQPIVVENRELGETLSQIVMDGDVVLAMGAGSISQLMQQIFRAELRQESSINA